MRRLIAVAVLLVAGAAWGKDKPLLMPVNEAGEFEYTGKFDVDGVTADELYSRAKAWVAVAYRSAQAVIQLDDKDAHRLIVKGDTTTSFGMEMVTVRHVLTIETKDEKYRYSLGAFTVGFNSGMEPAMTPKFRKVANRTHAEVSGIVASLEEAMKVEADDDW